MRTSKFRGARRSIYETHAVKQARARKAAAAKKHPMRPTALVDAKFVAFMRARGVAGKIDEPGE